MSIYNKTYLIFIFLQIITFGVIGQDDMRLTHKEVVVGTNFETKSEIVAKIYTSPHAILSLNVNYDHDLLSIQQKEIYNQASITFYNLSDKKEKWYKSIESHERIDQYDTILIYNTGGKSIRLDIQTGKELWKKNYNIYQAYPSHNIGIGYKRHNNKMLEGLDLTTGKSVWKREISNKYGWNEMFPLSNSSILISSSGLHTVHITSGRGWDFDAQTGKNNQAEIITSNILLAFLGALTDTEVMMTTGYDTVSELVSNTALDEKKNIYYASRNKIICLDGPGTVIWERNLPKSKASKSSLVVREGIVYLINLGVAYFNGELTYQGTPYITAFEKESGKQLYLSYITKEKTQINDFIINNKGIHLLLDHQISLYNKTTGELISETSIDNNSTFFIDNNNYIKVDSTYESLNYLYPALTFVHNKEDNSIIGYDNKLEIQHLTTPNKLFTLYMETDGYLFLSNEDKTVVINYNNEVVAELNFPISSKTFIVGNTLYDVKEKHFTEINLDYLLQFPD